MRESTSDICIVLLWRVWIKALNSAAILCTPGTAVAQVLLGIGPDANPAARLPITYYSDMDVAGDITNYSMHQRTYRYSAVAGSATFPFGFGLGYSPFVYESVTWTRLSTPASVETIMPKAPTIRPCDAIQLNVTVRNTGYFDGDEVLCMSVADFARLEKVHSIGMMV